MSRKAYKKESLYLNNVTYIDIYNQLQNLAMNCFKWTNLPDSVDERFLEHALYWKGLCLYFNDEVMGNLCLQCTIGGELNVYNIPKMRTAYANNGYINHLSQDDSVIIYNNYLHTPTDFTIRNYALRLYEIKRAQDVNVKRQKTPQILLTTPQQKLTIENMMAQYDGNVPFIYADKNLMPEETFPTIDTNAPYIADKLEILYHNIWNEALTFCGIENSNQDKKERLVESEVSGNYGNVEAQRNVMLNMREQACEKINKMFGTNINVEFRSNLKSRLNEAFGKNVEELENV